MSDEEFIDLAAKCLDGAATARDREALFTELQSSETRAAEYWNQAAIALALRAAFDSAGAARLRVSVAARIQTPPTGEFTRDVMREVRRSPALMRSGRPDVSKSKNMRSFALSGATVLVIAAAAWLGWTSLHTRAEFILIQTHGEIAISRHGRRIAGSAGTKLETDDAVSIGPRSSARIGCKSEGVVISLEPRTDLAFSVQKNLLRCLLSRGGVTGQVEHRPRSREIRFDTPNASARIVGTEFHLKLVGSASRLEVLTGKVAFTDLAAQKTVETDAGQSAVAAPDVELEVQSLAPLSKARWRLETSGDPKRLALAIDGDGSTSWRSGSTQTPGEWLVLDLGEERRISKIDFACAKGGEPRGVRIFASKLRGHWGSPIFEGAGEEAMPLIFAPRTVRFVRLELSDLAPEPWIVTEIEAYE